MTKRGRQTVLLVVLAMVLLALVWLQLGRLRPDDSATRRSSVLASGGLVNPGRSALDDQLPRVEELRLSDLQQGAGHYSPGRDPFRFGEVARPPSRNEELARAAIRRAQQEAQAKKEEKKLPPPSPPAPTPPPVDVVFLGSFGPQSRRLAVFSDGSDIFNVLEGDVLKEKFIVVRIGYESADLGFIGFPNAPAERLEIGG